MAILSTIMSNIEQGFQINVLGKVPTKMHIDGVKFLTEKELACESLSPFVLYLADYAKFPNVQTKGTFLFTNCNSDDYSEKYYYIKENISIIDLFNTIEETMLAHHELQMIEDDLFRALHNGSGISGILSTAYQYLNNPISLCDTSFSIIDSYPPNKDERNLVQKGSRLSLRDIFTQNMKDHDIVDAIFHSRFPFVTKVEDFPFDWVFESVRIGHAVVGYICIRANERELIDGDLDFIHTLTKMLSIELQKNNNFSNPYGMKFDYFFKDLIRNHFETHEEIETHIRLLGAKPEPYYFLISLGFTDENSRISASKYYSDQISSILPNSINGMYANRFIVLFPSKNNHPFDETIRSKTEIFLQMNKMVATVSYPFRNLLESSLYFQQCNTMLTHKISKENQGQIFYYDNYFFSHILTFCAKPNLLKASIHPTIKYISDYDKQNNTEYLTTLRVYLSNNRNALISSQELHIHKSTFFYRLGKLSELFGIDFSNSQSLFAFDYSFRILDYLAK